MEPYTPTEFTPVEREFRSLFGPRAEPVPTHAPAPGLGRLSFKELWQEFAKNPDAGERVSVLTAIRYASANPATLLDGGDYREPFQTLLGVANNPAEPNDVRQAAQSAAIALVPDGEETRAFRNARYIDDNRAFGLYLNGSVDLQLEYIHHYIREPQKVLAWIKLYAPQHILYFPPNQTTEGYPCGDYVSISAKFIDDLVPFIDRSSAAEAEYAAWRLPRILGAEDVPILTYSGELRIIADDSWMVYSLKRLAEAADRLLTRDSRLAPEAVSSDLFRNMTPSESLRLVTRIGEEMTNLADEVSASLHTDIFAKASKHGPFQFHFGMRAEQIASLYAAHGEPHNWVLDPDEGQNFLRQLGYRNLDMSPALGKMLEEDFISRFHAATKYPNGGNRIVSIDILQKVSENEQRYGADYRRIPDSDWPRRGAFAREEYRKIARRFHD